MTTLPPPSFDPRALLPMPGRTVKKTDARASAAELLGNQRALLSDAPSTGMSMLSLRSTSTKKRRR